MSDFIATSFFNALTVASSCSFIILVRRTFSGNDTAPIPSLVKKLSVVLVRQNHLPLTRSNASIPATGTLKIVTKVIFVLLMIFKCKVETFQKLVNESYVAAVLACNCVLKALYLSFCLNKIL